MKKASLLGILVAFCIILSFFACVYAESTTQFNVGETNIADVRETNDGVTTIITANANYDNARTGTITFSPKSTGVFTIDVEGDTRMQDEDLYYILTDSSGKEVRLAAYYDSASDKYLTFSNDNKAKESKIDVLLKGGETYTLNLSSYKAKYNSNDPMHAPYGGATMYYTYVQNSTYKNANYKVVISVNTDNENVIGNVFQSDISAREISEDTPTRPDSLEAADANYQLPAGKTAELNEYDLGNAIIEVGEGALEVTNEYIINPLEETICELLLALGDFLVNLMNSIIGEEVTVTKLVYNQVDSVNANFFDKSIVANGVSANIRTVVNKWYNVFTMIAVAIYIVVLLGIGVNVLLSSTSDGSSKAKELLTQWVKGIATLVFIPYLIKYAFLLNESLVGMLRESAGIPDYSMGSSFTSAGEWSVEEIEFRSPEYVSNYTGSVAFGSDEATESYINKVTTYEQNLDLMRIMRAYAGVTKKIIYVIIWFILIGQLISFIVQYYKRYFMIAFLIAMFPVVCIFHGISIAQGATKGEIGTWVKEILTNIFIQFVHAIIYTTITGMCISVVQEDIQSSATLNWIVIILAINFVSEGEKILRKLIGAMGNTAGGSGETSKGIKGAYGKIRDGAKKMFS